jgi:capsular exopolysaccharide synthesis family protein
MQTPDSTNKGNSLIAASDEEAALMKVRKTIFKYLSNIHLFIIFLLISITAAFLYLKYTSPVYRASSTLLLGSDDKGGGSEKDLIDAMVSGQPKVNIQDEIELIKSRYLLNRVVEKNKFNVDVWVVGRILTTELGSEVPFQIQGVQQSSTVPNSSFDVHFVGPGKFKIEKGSKVYGFFDSFFVNKEAFRLLPNPPGSPANNAHYKVRYNNTITAASMISGGLKITPKSTASKVVELSYTGQNPQKIQLVLQKVMEEYVQLGVDEKRKVQENTLDFIKERLAVLSGELGTVEGQLESFRTYNNVIDVTSQSQQSLEQVAEQGKDLSKLMVQRQVISYLLEYLNDKTNPYNLTPTTLGIEDPVLVSLSQNYNALILEREKELILNTAISPVIKNLEATIEKARGSLLENLKSIRANNELSIQKLSGERNRMQSMISSVPGKERKLGGIMRQEKIKNELFSYLLQKREETEIALAGALTEAKVLNTALTLPGPISPNRRTVWLLAALIGIAIPLIIMWIRDLLNNKVNTRSDITDKVHVPLLGEIGHNATEEAIVVKPASRKVIGEQFRNIRSNINFLIPGKKNFIILTTSSNAGEGKSFISINLAATYAVAGKKTILVEMDLRKPKLDKYVKMQSGIGLTDYLINVKSLSSVIRDFPGYENLKIILSGPIPPNPSELLLQEKMEELVTQLKRDFEIIIFDCPPVGLVTDAQLVSPYVDLSVYVVRQRKTLKTQLSFINELYEGKRLSNMGIIVNDVKVNGYHGYYGYGNYGGYGYGGYGYGVDKSADGNGYFEKETKRRGWLSKKIFNH